MLHEIDRPTLQQTLIVKIALFKEVVTQHMRLSTLQHVVLSKVIFLSFPFNYCFLYYRFQQFCIKYRDGRTHKVALLVAFQRISILPVSRQTVCVCATRL